MDRVYQNDQCLSIRTLVENLCCLFGVRINYIFAGLLSVISQGGGFMASGQEWKCFAMYLLRDKSINGDVYTK